MQRLIVHRHIIYIDALRMQVSSTTPDNTTIWRSEDRRLPGIRESDKMSGLVCASVTSVCVLAKCNVKDIPVESINVPRCITVRHKKKAEDIVVPTEKFAGRGISCPSFRDDTAF
jgi:hypothetical protein